MVRWYVLVISARLCYDVSVRLSVTEVHWRIIANFSFKFRSKFTACARTRSACGRALRLAVHAGALRSRCMPGRAEGSSHTMLATARPLVLHVVQKTVRQRKKSRWLTTSFYFTHLNECCVTMTGASECEGGWMSQLAAPRVGLWSQSFQGLLPGRPVVGAVCSRTEECQWIFNPQYADHVCVRLWAKYEVLHQLLCWKYLINRLHDGH